MKHTPGPWTVELDLSQDGDIDVLAADMVMIARIDCRECPEDEDQVPREVALANANAIAAVPEMLAALKAVEAAQQDDVPPEVESAIQQRVSAAIAKAEGR